MDCKNCGKEIEEGEEISLGDEGGYVCSDECLDEYFG